MAEKREEITIDSLISKAEHDKHAKTSSRANLAIHQFAYGQLIKYYKKSLPEAERAKFDAIGDDENKLEKELELIDEFAKKDGKLPYEHADALVKDIAYSILRKVNKTAAKDMKEQLALLKKKDSTADQRAEALQKIKQYMGMTIPYGINLEELKKDGIQKGFTSNLISEHFEKFQNAYHTNLRDSYLDQIKESDLDKHLPKIKSTEAKDEEGKVLEFNRLNVDTIKKAPYETKRQLVLMHKNALKRKEEGGLQTYFKAIENQYLADADKKAA